MHRTIVRAVVCAVVLTVLFQLPGQAQLNLDELRKQLGIGGKTGDILDKTFKTLQALGPIGYEEEKAIGGALAVEAFQRFGPPANNPMLVRYVNLVGTSVALHSNRPDIPYHFAVLNHNQPNAFATPGGYVFVTVGLLRLARSEAELAGVLGHEIAHVTQKHALQTLQRSQILQGLSELTLTALDKNPAMFDKVLNEMSSLLFDRGLDQNLEFEADRLGAEYAARVGYSPTGLQRVLARLARQQGYRQTGLFKTHPDPRLRAQRLHQAVQRQYGPNPGGQELSQRFATIFKP
jgi:predicted Zn-dependent protease